MKQSLLLLVVLFTAHLLMAKTKHAHSHGEVKLQIAFEEQKGLISWQVASDAIIGFEHRGKNEAQKKLIQDKIQALKSDSHNLYQLPTQCALDTHQVEQVFESKVAAAHSEIQVNSTVTCQKAVQGSELGFNIQSQYPKIKNWEIQIDTPSGSQQFKSKKDPKVKL